jgi:hypothetical protein
VILVKKIRSVLSVICTLFAPTVHSQPLEATAAWIKETLASPPIVEEVLFDWERRVLNSPLRERFQLRWQDGNVVLRDLTPEMDPRNPQARAHFVMGHLGNDYWFIDPNDFLQFWRRNPEQTQDVSPFGFYKINIQTAHTLMNLGMVNLKPGTLRWTNDSFEASAHDGSPIKGRLETADGALDLIFFGKIGNGTLRTNIIRYSQFRTNAPYYPTKYELLRAPHGPVMMTVLIERFITSDRPLTLDYFRPARYQLPTTRIILYTNGMVVSVHGKKLEILQRPAPHDSTKPVIQNRRTVYFFLAGSLILVLGASVAFKRTIANLSKRYLD